MIKSYLAQLELRIEAVSKLLGDTSDFKESDVKDVREGINEIVSKLHKDNSRRFERIKKTIEKYGQVIDTVPTHDKLTLVHAEIEELSQVAAQLDRIQKAMDALNTENYLKAREKYTNLRQLDSCSQLQQGQDQRVKVKQASEEPLLNLRTQHRRSLNELAELNGKVVKNLSAKLQAFSNRRLKETAV